MGGLWLRLPLTRGFAGGVYGSVKVKLDWKRRESTAADTRGAVPLETVGYHHRATAPPSRPA